MFAIYMCQAQKGTCDYLIYLRDYQKKKLTVPPGLVTSERRRTKNSAGLPRCCMWLILVLLAPGLRQARLTRPARPEFIDWCHQSNVAHGMCLPDGLLRLNFSHAR